VQIGITLHFTNVECIIIHADAIFSDSMETQRKQACHAANIVGLGLAPEKEYTAFAINCNGHFHIGAYREKIFFPIGEQADMAQQAMTADLSIGRPSRPSPTGSRRPVPSSDKPELPQLFLLPDPVAPEQIPVDKPETHAASLKHLVI
jgi:hypothetical protein